MTQSKHTGKSDKKLPADSSEVPYDKYIACIELYKLIVRQLPSIVRGSDYSLRHIVKQIKTNQPSFYRKLKDHTLSPDVIQSALSFLRQNPKNKKNKPMPDAVVFNNHSEALLICSLSLKNKSVNVFLQEKSFFTVTNARTVKNISEKEAFRLYMNPKSIKQPPIPPHKFFSFLELKDIDIDANSYVYQADDFKYSISIQDKVQATKEPLKTKLTPANNKITKNMQEKNSD